MPVFRINKVVATATVCSKAKLADFSKSLCGNYSRRGCIAEDGAVALISRVQIFVVSLGSEQEYFLRHTASDKTFCYGLSIHITRTTEVIVNSSDVGAQPKPVLVQTSRCRQFVVWTLCAEHHKVYVRLLNITFCKQFHRSSAKAISVAVSPSMATLRSSTPILSAIFSTLHSGKSFTNSSLVTTFSGRYVAIFFM